MSAIDSHVKSNAMADERSYLLKNTYAPDNGLKGKARRCSQSQKIVVVAAEVVVRLLNY